MTSPSRRKRPTTARGPSTATTTAFERRLLPGTIAAALALVLAAGAAPAQIYTPLQAPTPGDPAWAPATPRPFPAVTTARPRQQPPAMPGRLGDPRDLLEETPVYPIQTDAPGPERLFRLESESALLERLRQQARDQRRSAYDTTGDLFPEEPVLSRETYAGRAWPPRSLLVEPGYVCYKRLLFEQRNAERFGWDLGAIQPLVSLGEFYFDLAVLPYNLASRPLCCFDCGAGYCLPGDPVPYVLYPPPISVTGGLAEAATVVALFVLFP